VGCNSHGNPPLCLVGSTASGLQQAGSFLQMRSGDRLELEWQGQLAGKGGSNATGTGQGHRLPVLQGSRDVPDAVLFHRNQAVHVD